MAGKIFFGLFARSKWIEISNSARGISSTVPDCKGSGSLRQTSQLANNFPLSYDEGVNVREAIQHAARELGSRREAQYLVSSFLEKDPAWLITHPDALLERPLEFADWTRKRSQGIPLAYLRQWQEFFGRRFYVDERVLIPRPETELLIEEALQFASDFPADIRVADVGTGCGCVAITLALELPRVQIVATDISPDALTVAQRNAEAFAVSDRICFLAGDLLLPLQQRVDWILANPPYVALKRWQEEPSLAYEPLAALVGEGDGTGTICRLLRQAPPLVNHPGRILVEIGEDQGGLVEEAQTLFPAATIDLLLDLAGLPRLLRIVI